MKKIKFNNKLFNIIPSPDKPNVSFVFNKENGIIFQVEYTTSELILKLKSRSANIDEIIKFFAKKYKMNWVDIKNFKKIINKMQNNKVIIET